MAKSNKKSPTTYQDERGTLEARLREGQYAPVYLVMGEQDYLRTQNRNLIRSALLGAGDAMNAAYYTGDHFTIQEIRDLADTMPFLSERRVITIEDSWLFAKASSETDALTDYLEQMPDTTHLVFVEKSPNKTTRLYKQIKRMGVVLDCVTPDAASLRNWAAERFREAGLAIENDALSLFMEDAGEDMLRIQAEMDKLISYCMGRQTIHREDVQAICSAQLKDRIFDMISAITARNTTEALAIYTELLQLQTVPQVILALMIRNFNQLLQVGELAARRMPAQEIASTVGMSPWILRNKIMPALAGQTTDRLVAALDLCLQKDMDYKSGRIDARIAVEELIICCSARDS